MKKNRTVLIIAEVAILSALSLVLDYLANVTTGSLFVSGGSISIAMLPIMVISFRRGLIAGLASGLIVGTLQVIWGGHILQFFQYIFDYPIAYTVVGFAGIFTYLNKRKIKKTTIIFGAIFAGILRYISHVLAGIFFWGEYAKETFDFLNKTITGFNVYTWSLFYNSLYMIPSMIVTVVVLVILYVYAKEIFVLENNNEYEIEL